MSKLVLLLIAISVSLSAIAQIVLKTGMNQPLVLDAIKSGTQWLAFKSIASSPWVLGGLFLYFSSAAVWLLVLSKTDVSIAYPFVGLGFILTMLLAFFINGEAITMTKLCGTLLISIGVFVIAKG